MKFKDLYEIASGVLLISLFCLGVAAAIFASGCLALWLGSMVTRWFSVSTAQGAFLFVALAGLLVVHYGLRTIAHSIQSEEDEDGGFGHNDWEDEPWSEDPNFRVSRSKADVAGRNDPCPCGSGKKFKKCCIEQ
jgi:hypothetical protein